MTAVTSIRTVSGSGAGSCWSWSNSDPIDRRGQDKSRNVRAVDRGENSSVGNGLAHIAWAIRTLPIFTERLRCSTFRTFRPRQ
jgi:hypothetical protein